MVGLTGIEPVVWICNPLKSLSLFLLLDSARQLFVYFYSQDDNLVLLDKSNYFTRHFRPVTPYTDFFFTFFAVLSSDLNNLLVQN